MTVAVSYSEHMRQLLRDHVLTMQGYPRFAQPKRTRRSRRRARGRRKAEARRTGRGYFDQHFLDYSTHREDAHRYLTLGDTHIGELSPTARRNRAKQFNYYLGAYCSRERAFFNREPVVVIDGGDLLHEFRTFHAIDWEKIETRALAQYCLDDVEFTKMQERVTRLADETLRGTLSHGSSEDETNRGLDHET